MKHPNEKQMLFHMLARIDYSGTLPEAEMELGYLCGDYFFHNSKYYDKARTLVKQLWLELHEMGKVA